MRPRRQKPPVFMGQPSPSLAKLERMNREELTQHIQRLVTERERLMTRITNLGRLTPPPQEKLENLAAQVVRIEALEKLSRQRLEQKQDRAAQYSRTGGPGGSGGPGGGRPGFRASRNPRR